MKRKGTIFPQHRPFKCGIAFTKYFIPTKCNTTIFNGLLNTKTIAKLEKAKFKQLTLTFNMTNVALETQLRLLKTKNKQKKMPAKFQYVIKKKNISHCSDFTTDQ